MILLKNAANRCLLVGDLAVISQPSTRHKCMNATIDIDFVETENQKLVSQMVRDFGAREIRPKMMEWDEEQIFPVDLFHKMGALGLMGVLVPEEYSGAGFGYLEYITA